MPWKELEQLSWNKEVSARSGLVGPGDLQEFEGKGGRGAAVGMGRRRGYVGALQRNRERETVEFRELEEGQGESLSELWWGILSALRGLK